MQVCVRVTDVCSSMLLQICHDVPVLAHVCARAFACTFVLLTYVHVLVGWW